MSGASSTIDSDLAAFARENGYDFDGLLKNPVCLDTVRLLYRLSQAEATSSAEASSVPGPGPGPGDSEEQTCEPADNTPGPKSGSAGGGLEGGAVGPAAAEPEKGHPSPAFQFYPSDWLASDDIALMTPAEEGAYVHLLCHAWLQPDCGLPDCDKDLAGLSRLGKKFQNSSERLRAKFRTEGGRLYNDRLLRERQKQENYRVSQRESGCAGARKRWGRHRVAINSPMAKNSSSVSIPDITPIVPFDFVSHFEELWEAYPKKGRIKRPDAERWYVEKLTMAPDPDTLHQHILDSVRGKWAASKFWADSYIPGLGEFLRLERWQEDPEPAAGTEATVYKARLYVPPPIPEEDAV